MANGNEREDKIRPSLCKLNCAGTLSTNARQVRAGTHCQPVHHTSRAGTHCQPMHHTFVLTLGEAFLGFFVWLSLHTDKHK